LSCGTGSSSGGGRATGGGKFIGKIVAVGAETEGIREGSKGDIWN
jgi:hypothetical protein